MRLQSKVLPHKRSWKDIVALTLGIDTKRFNDDCQPTFEQYADAITEATRLHSLLIGYFYNPVTDQQTAYVSPELQASWAASVLSVDDDNIEYPPNPAEGNQYSDYTEYAYANLLMHCALLARIMHNKAFPIIEMIAAHEKALHQGQTPNLQAFFASAAVLPITSLKLNEIPGVSLMHHGPLLQSLQTDLNLFDSELSLVLDAMQAALDVATHEGATEVCTVHLTYALALFIQYISFVNGEGASFQGDYFPVSVELLQERLSQNTRFQNLKQSCLEKLAKSFGLIHQRLLAELTQVVADYQHQAKIEDFDHAMAKQQLLQTVLPKLQLHFINLIHFDQCFPFMNIEVMPKFNRLWDMLKQCDCFANADLSFDADQVGIWPEVKATPQKQADHFIGDGPSFLAKLLARLQAVSQQVDRTPVPEQTISAPKLVSSSISKRSAFDNCTFVFLDKHGKKGLITLLNELKEVAASLNLDGDALRKSLTEAADAAVTTCSRIEAKHQQQANDIDAFLAELPNLMKVLFACQQVAQIHQKQGQDISKTLVVCIESLQGLRKNLELLQEGRTLTQIINPDRPASGEYSLLPEGALKPEECDKSVYGSLPLLDNNGAGNKLAPLVERSPAGKKQKQAEIASMLADKQNQPAKRPELPTVSLRRHDKKRYKKVVKQLLPAEIIATILQQCEQPLKDKRKSMLLFQQQTVQNTQAFAIDEKLKRAFCQNQSPDFVAALRELMTDYGFVGSEELLTTQAKNLGGRLYLFRELLRQAAEADSVRRGGAGSHAAVAGDASQLYLTMINTNENAPAPVASSTTHSQQH